MTDQKPIVYEESGITYYRASSLMMCPRNFIYARQGLLPSIPKPLQEAFDYGTTNESRVLDMATARGYNIINRQHVTRLPVGDGSTVIIGHIDGTAQLDTLIEVKCLNHTNTETFLNNHLNFTSYMWQISTYLHSMKMTNAVFLIYDKDEDALYERRITIPPISKAEIVAHVARLNYQWRTFQSTDQLPDCTKPDFCPFSYQHATDKDPIPDVTDPILTSLLLAYATLSDGISSRETLRSKIRTQLEDRITLLETPKGRTATHSYALSLPNTRTVLDTKAVTRYLQDNNVLEKYQRTSAVRPRLEVTRNEGGQ